MTPTEITELRDMVAAVSSKLDTSIELRAQAERHTAQELADIKSQTEKTNGRVNGLEDWKQRAVGAAWAFGLIWTVGTVGVGLFLAFSK